MLLGNQKYNRQPSSDASGRLRVGQLTTLADLKIINSDDPLLWESVGTGSDSFDQNKSSMQASPGQYGHPKI